uniref:Uncharacterized protein n=1 Tax=Echinococcus granulosus TaxID=6210 RepID=A0A068WJ17_ECHGR|nr:hypothetical protein EgrG_000507200 [Echinococcus granulosus]
MCNTTRTRGSDDEVNGCTTVIISPQHHSHLSQELEEV